MCKNPKHSPKNKPLPENDCFPLIFITLTYQIYLPVAQTNKREEEEDKDKCHLHHHLEEEETDDNTRRQEEEEFLRGGEKT